MPPTGLEDILITSIMTEEGTRTSFSHKLVMYQSEIERDRAQRTSDISYTNQQVRKCRKSHFHEVIYLSSLYLIS